MTMSLRCDHCRQQVGLIVYRYWRMRFCSTPCKDAYQRRLAEETKVKIGHLDFVNGAGSRNERIRAA
jgi:hypothetical protein